VANGRRHKCHITSLTSEEGVITDPKLIQEHIYAFYRELLGTIIPRGSGLASNIWGGVGHVSEEENNSLALTFTEIELGVIFKEMKTDTAPGPDGFPVLFFKQLWPQLKLGIFHILNNFVLGTSTLPG
jgi:hypothetical protein